MQGGGGMELLILEFLFLFSAVREFCVSFCVKQTTYQGLGLDLDLDWRCGRSGLRILVLVLGNV